MTELDAAVVFDLADVLDRGLGGAMEHWAKCQGDEVYLITEHTAPEASEVSQRAVGAALRAQEVFDRSGVRT